MAAEAELIWTAHDSFREWAQSVTIQVRHRIYLAGGWQKIPMLDRFKRQPQQPKRIEFDVDSEPESGQEPAETETMQEMGTRELILEMLYKLDNLDEKVEKLDLKVDMLDQKMFQRNDDDAMRSAVSEDWNLAVIADDVAEIKSKVSSIREAGSLLDLGEIKSKIDDLHFHQRLP